MADIWPEARPGTGGAGERQDESPRWEPASPARQMKIASSNVTSSLSRAREATRSPTSRRLMSRCRNRNRMEKAKTDHLDDNGDGVSLEEVEGQ